LDAEAGAVVVARAAAIGAKPPWRLGREVSHSRRGDSLVITLPDGTSFEVDPRLQGAHQDDNAAVAVAAAWLLRCEGDSSTATVDSDAVARGVRDVQWPGRLETLAVREGPSAGRYLLDCAHNEHGVRALASAIRATTELVSPVLVFGAMADKAWTAMVQLLAPLFRDRVYVAPSVHSPGRAAVRLPDLRSLDSQGLCASTVSEAVGVARGLAGLESTVVIAGSLYLVGEVRALLLAHHESWHGQVGL
jgi:dihydrofolate synthase/folylpolyglutamate synthase